MKIGRWVRERDEMWNVCGEDIRAEVKDEGGKKRGKKAAKAAYMESRATSGRL